MAALDIALVTCARMAGGWEDDQLLADEIARRGASVAFVCWDDPSVHWGSVGVAAIRSTWDYFERVEAFLGWADHAGSVTTLVNDAKTVRWNAHKAYLLDLEAAGVPVVPTKVVRRGTQHVLGAGRWVVKPAVSAGADRTTRDATQHDLDVLVATDDLLVQPYVEDIESRGELSIVCVSGLPLHALRKVPAPGDYLSQEHLGASVTPIAITEAQRQMATAALAAAPSLPTYARVDVVDAAEGLLLMELELIEPTLWLEHSEPTVAALADALLSGAGQRPGSG